MNKYRDSHELQGKVLCIGDMVDILGIIHQVSESFNEGLFLGNLEKCGANDVIFTKLGIHNRYVFCKEQYGYKASCGQFPEARDGDFEALTRVTIALLQLSET